MSKTEMPSIRFRGFGDAWEQRKLGDVVKEITRNDPESEAPIMMITANNGFIEQSERYAFNNAGESLKKYILLKKGELAYNHGASKLRPYGSCFALTTAENARIPFVYHCFSAENQNAEFMSIELNGAEIENQLRKIVSSGARMDGLLNISFDEYTSVSVLLPGTEEQDRIADFFRHLDNLITFHQRKFEKLTNVKKSMLEKMFPRNGSCYPEIRFKGFTDPWEQRKLGEFALFNPKDELPQTFEYVDLESVVGTEMLSHRTEVKSSAPSRAQRLAHTGDLFYQTVRPYQKNNYLFEKPDNNYVFSTGYAQMRPYVDGYFLLSLVQSERFVKVVLDNCTGTSYPAINANDLAEIEVAAPSDESEAQKIGTIFRSIDNLITLHQRELEKLQSIKKALLEKMFV